MHDPCQQINALPALLPLWTGTVVLGLAALSGLGRLTPARAATVVVATSYVAVVLALTFFPLQITPGGSTDVDGWVGQLNLVPVVTIDTFTFVLNVAMTIPLGMLAPSVLQVTTVRSVALVGLGVSAGIEGLQLAGNVVLGSSRVVDVNDLLANVAGVVLGWFLVQQLRRDPGLDQLAASLDLWPPAAPPEPALVRAQELHTA